jgi:hypothetical protein
MLVALVFALAAGACGDFAWHDPDPCTSYHGTRWWEPHTVYEPRCEVGVRERCNGFDDDCDDRTDEGTFCAATDPYPIMLAPSVWAAAPNDVWFVSGSHALLGFDVVAHWDGSRMQIFDLGCDGLPVDVAGTATDDVWVVGEGGLVAHWDGRSWSLVETGTYVDFTGVWAAARDDVWVVGAATAMHWDGTEWTDRWPDPCHWGLNDVDGSGRDDVWVAGESGGVAHWNGTEWDDRLQDAPRLWWPRLRVAGPGDVWMVGESWDGGLQVAYHWDGVEWQPIEARSAAGLTAPTGPVWGAAPGETWLLSGDGIVARVSATGWEWLPPSLVENASSLGGTGPEDAWVVGYGMNGWLDLSFDFAHWDGREWRRPDGIGGAALLGIGGVAGGPIWVVGEPRRAAGAAGGLWEKTAEGWMPVRTAPDLQLNDVWAVSPREAWAVGEGVVLHRTGGVWSESTVTAGASPHFLGIHGVAADDVWMVGSGYPGSDGDGVVFHWDGSAWTWSFRRYGDPLRDVWAAATDDVWAVGGTPGAEGAASSRGVILHWDGTEWFPWPDLHVALVSAIQGFAADDIWAVTWAGQALHWDGSSWTVLRVEGASGLNDVWGSSPEDAWIAGDSGFAAQLVGGTWEGRGASWGALRALWGPSPAETYAVTLDGRILTRTD